ncbi:hypothetical protein [Desulfogranum marinum]|uniref:hypothetical protein n=1 Tax=Desulfogranum marinum TaxID=453220 RepID=UPI00374DA336
MYVIRFQFTSPSPEIFGLSYPCTFAMLFDCIVDEERSGVKLTLDSACATQQPFSINYRIVLPDGCEPIIFNLGEVVHTDQQSEPLLIGIVQDITELKQAEDKIDCLAFYYNLTGLANRSLEENELAPCYLKLELTERVMMENADDARGMLLELKKRGVPLLLTILGPDIPL